ncbi:Monomeric sarcosine oxidase [Methylobacterium crusticola]|uniref:Monomeric sarcosine oxidase n=1 Tax=Methylobacterium crusticola TaxID=1697972 RepID=A0ABQ4R1E7_9HYPH|nr:FAD-dependent oxidoreductase [Methylobacterium crusticola]GJD51378.1 Monomeric sarcosine oxidase [Methylobacterium crusticola]
MTERLAVDVAIVGGGTGACAAAVALREAGLTVAVIEKRLCGGGASGVNFGGVRQQGRHLAELPLSRRARALWDGLDARLGEDVAFEASGHVKLARSEADMAALEAYARSADGHGLDLQLLGPNAVRAAMPWLGTAVVGASLSPTDGQANPRVVGPAFARLARRLGAEVREHAPVRHAARAGEGFVVEAEGLAVRSRLLVNAAGAFAGTVAGWFGEAAPVAPLRPNMVVTEPLPFRVPRSIGVVGGDVYVRQVRRGNVILGGGRGTGDPADDLARPAGASARGAMGRTLALIPDLAHAQVIRTWSGLDGEMPDHIPVIGPSATTPGLVHAFGFSGHGFQLGPVVGEILAELVTRGRSALPLHPFRIERFAGWRGGPHLSAGEIEH